MFFASLYFDHDAFMYHESWIGKNKSLLK